MNTVNEKYSEKENNEIINNIPSFSFKTFNLNDNNNNCIVCMCEIEENEECKKLKMRPYVS